MIGATSLVKVTRVVFSVAAPECADRKNAETSKPAKRPKLRMRFIIFAIWRPRALARGGKSLPRRGVLSAISKLLSCDIVLHTERRHSSNRDSGYCSLRIVAREFVKENRPSCKSSQRQTGLG